MNSRKLVVIGPEPPPLTGMEVATRALLLELQSASIPYLRIDTADPTDELGNRARWTFHNVALAIRHLVETIGKSAKRDVGAVYLPIAQEFPALFRDLAFVSIAHAFRKPVIVHLHGGALGEYYRSRNIIVRWILRSLLKNVTLGIVLTERLRPALECVVPPDRVAVVANGVDIPSKEVRATPSDGSVKALFLSSVFLTKGPVVFLEALARARDEHPELRGIVAGSWPSADVREQIMALVARLSLEESVELHGMVEGEKKIQLLREADMFCLPAIYPEGQPLVIIEAMAAGLPVVATAWPGIADTVVDGETGLLVEAPRSDLVAEKFAVLAADKDARERMGAAGRRRYEQLYTQQAFGARMIEVLRPFLHGPG